MSIQDPRKCKHYDNETCDKNKHKAEADGTYWVYPCRLFHGYHCPDFTLKDPQLCTHYGADGGCHKHSQKHGNIHVSIRCKTELEKPCKDYKTNKE